MGTASRIRGLGRVKVRRIRWGSNILHLKEVSKGSEFFLCQGTVSFERIDKPGVWQVGIEPTIFGPATRRSVHYTIVGSVCLITRIRG